MNKQQAIKLLGLTGDEQVEEITSTFQYKLKLVEDKLSSAPTDALKQKLEQMKVALRKAHQILTETTQAKTPTKPSPLSQTKMADLPGVGHANSSSESLVIGTILSERYEIKEFIAQGGMGAVYRVFDKNRDEDIAIKVMLPDLLKNETAKERFLDEARLSSRLSHPNIVNVYDVIQDGELCFLTMELLEGQDLRELMTNRKTLRQNFTVEEVIEILKPICAALEHAHEITIHRDIKPENIFLTEDEKYKLMDFGIARIMSSSQRTATGATTGTAYYMAPEQLKGLKNIDGRVDQYALGVLAYELLSGEVPAGVIEPLHELDLGISKVASLSIQKALSARAENRHANLNDFIASIETKQKQMNMPALNFKKLAVPAGIVFALILIVGIFSSNGLGNLWDSIMPASQEEKANAAKLHAEVVVLKNRLLEGRRNLEKEIIKLERDLNSNHPDLKRLNLRKKLSEKYLFEGDLIVELEGDLSMSDIQLKDNNIKNALVTLTNVRDGYKNLWKEFKVLDEMIATRQNVSYHRNRLLDRRQKYSLESPTEVGLAKFSEKEAGRLEQAGKFVDAKKQWSQAKNHWSKAYIGMNDEVAGVDAKRQVEVAKQNRIVQAKAAALKALAQKRAEKERQRLAGIKRQRQAEDKAKAKIESKRQADCNFYSRKIREVKDEMNYKLQNLPNQYKIDQSADLIDEIERYCRKNRDSCKYSGNSFNYGKIKSEKRKLSRMQSKQDTFKKDVKRNFNRVISQYKQDQRNKRCN